MGKLTWEDLERKDIAIHTPYKELMVKVANIIADKYNDITYEQNKIKSERDGRSYPDAYYAYEEDTCVELTHNELTHNEWHFADKEYFLYNDYEIVEYEDVVHLFEDYIDTTETKEIEYLVKVKLKNGEEGYFMEEWRQGEHWLFPVEEIKDADTYDDLTTLKEILNLHKKEIEEYKIIKRTTILTETFEFIE